MYPVVDAAYNIDAAVGQPQDIIFIRLLYPSPSGLPRQTKMLFLQKLLPWQSWLIWSSTVPIYTTLTLTPTLSLWPFGNRTWAHYGLPFGKFLWFVAALVN